MPDGGLLAAARAFGLEAVRSGATLGDVLEWHQRALGNLLHDSRPDSGGTAPVVAHDMLIATLGPFDEDSRSVLALRHVNQRFEEKVQRLAHALHEDTGQLLASVYLHVAEIAADMPHRGRQRLEDLRSLLDLVDDELRRTAHELRPTVLDDIGLIAACEVLAESLSRRTGVRVSIHGDAGGRLPAEVETALFRVVQEAVTNATRHSRGAHVVMNFERSGRWLRGSIRDDGAGFDVPAALGCGNRRGLGLMAMRERLIALAGKLSITSVRGSGTSIEFEVPVEY
jgi:signal transduction histidine kinase